MKKELLIIYLKNPYGGNAKTRLAKSIGKDGAAFLYETIIRDCLIVAENTDVDVCLSVANKDSLCPIKELTGEKYLYDVQEGDDIGERMYNSFNKYFSKGYEKIVLIGSDCPEIDEKLLQDAFHQMDRNQVVIGPAEDGGYYLIGFLSDIIKKEFFGDIDWSTDKVLMQTQKKMSKLSVYMCKTLSDIDDVYDLERYVKRHEVNGLELNSLRVAKELLKRR